VIHARELNKGTV